MFEDLPKEIKDYIAGFTNYSWPLRQTCVAWDSIVKTKYASLFPQKEILVPITLPFPHETIERWNLSHDGSKVVVIHQQKTGKYLYLYDREMQELGNYPLEPGFYKTPIFSPNSQFFISLCVGFLDDPSSTNYKMEKWNVDPLSLHFTRRGVDISQKTEVLYISDTALLASYCPQTSENFWILKFGPMNECLEIHPQKFKIGNFWTLSPDNTRLLNLTQDAIQIPVLNNKFSVNDHFDEIQLSPSLTSKKFTVGCLSNNNQQVAVAHTPANCIHIFDVATKMLEKTIPLKKDITIKQMVFIGEKLLLREKNPYSARVSVWDIKTGIRVAYLDGFAAQVNSNVNETIVMMKQALPGNKATRIEVSRLLHPALALTASPPKPRRICKPAPVCKPPGVV